jgi:hypothetical protein
LYEGWDFGERNERAGQHILTRKCIDESALPSLDMSVESSTGEALFQLFRSLYMHFIVGIHGSNAKLLGIEYIP